MNERIMSQWTTNYDASITIAAATREQHDKALHLLRAAPDMLAALKACEAMVSTNAGPPDWDAIRAIIARAEGKEP